LIDEILPFVLIGFFAQIVDGSIGMAYGVTINNFEFENNISSDLIWLNSVLLHSPMFLA